MDGKLVIKADIAQGCVSTWLIDVHMCEFTQLVYQCYYFRVHHDIVAGQSDEETRAECMAYAQYHVFIFITARTSKHVLTIHLGDRMARKYQQATKQGLKFRNHSRSLALVFRLHVCRRNYA